MTALTNVQRQAAYRSRGRQVVIVLKSPEACAALDALVLLLGSQRAAVEHALRMAGQGLERLAPAA